jgi:hypothetical protein
MNIGVYDDILEGLKAYNEQHSAENYGNAVVPYASSSPTFPLTIFDEIRNMPTRHNSCHDKVSSLGYKVEIYAKTKGNITKQTIARKIAKLIDDFLSGIVGLKQVSFNANPLINDASIYQIIITYENSYHENRARFY